MECANVWRIYKMSIHVITKLVTFVAELVHATARDVFIEEVNVASRCNYSIQMRIRDILYLVRHRELINGQTYSSKCKFHHYAVDMLIDKGYFVPVHRGLLDMDVVNNSEHDDDDSEHDDDDSEHDDDDAEHDDDNSEHDDEDAEHDDDDSVHDSSSQPMVMRTTKVTNVEKETYSSLRGIERVDNLMQILKECKNPLSITCEQIADLISMMERINASSQLNIFQLGSVEAMKRVKTRCMDEKRNRVTIQMEERKLIYYDLDQLQSSLWKMRNPEETGGDINELRRIMKPPHGLFNSSGFLNTILSEVLHSSGATTILLKEVNGSFVLHVEGDVTEVWFRQKLKSLKLENPNILHPKIEYVQRN